MSGETAIRVGGVVRRVVGVVRGGRGRVVVVVVSGGGGIVVVVVVAVVGTVVVVSSIGSGPAAVSFAEKKLVTRANAWHWEVIGGAGGASLFGGADARG